MVKTKTITLLIALMAMLITATMVLAENNVPLGAENVTVIQTETSNLSLYPPANITAEAGNVTELYISGVTQTKAWQGYYGNVSGTIILEDAQGNRFYDWTAAEPQGEVYTSINQTIDWTTVDCSPILDNTTESSYWNGVYGITDEDYDAINRTYNFTNHDTFYVGTRTQTGCPTSYTFVNDTRQASDFPAVLLSSDSNSTLIYTSLLENRTNGARDGIVGFDGENYDFQILVNEDGHNGDDTVTTYWFWVELE